MAQLNFGVIGVGEMGKRHAENLRANVPGAKLAAIADVSAARTSQVAAELGVAATHDNVEALVARTDVQAVVISSPPKFHAPAIMAAAAAGKHIFCEKPLALTLEDADAALDAVARAGVMLQVGHMRRYDPPYVAAKKRIDAGEIGDIVVFKSIGRDQETPASAAPATAINGTIFHDSSSHDFDLGRWLTSDEVVEVHAYSGSLAIPDMKRYGAFDCGVVNLQFSRGAIGNVESFLDAKYGYDIRTEIVGTKGTIQVGSLRRTAVTVLTSTGTARDNITHWLDRFAEAYRLEMVDFVQTVLAGGKVKVTGLDGRQSLAIADAAVRSQAERRPVAVRAARGVTA
jgi:predicted dehydrogenase